jgi:hypothetical protein
MDKWKNKISQIHLHGVSEKKDHKSLKYLDTSLLEYIVEFAHNFDITICLEVFKKDIFEESYNILRSVCENKNYFDYRWFGKW